MTKTTIRPIPRPKMERKESWISDKEENDDVFDDENRPDWKCIFPFHNRTRFFQLCLVQACLTICWCNILTFNFTLICMAPKRALNITNNMISLRNQSFVTAITPAPSGRLMGMEFTQSEKSWIMGAVAVADLITLGPVVLLITRFGSRKVFTALGFVSAIGTGLVPLAVLHGGFYYFLFCRVLQGIAFAGNMPVFGSFLAHWVYFKQMATFTAVLCTYVQLAPAFTMPVAGFLCESRWGWPAVYYVHCVMTVILFATFAFYYTDKPKKHRFISEFELNKINRGKFEVSKGAERRIPWKAIIKTPAVWAVWIGACGNFCGINLVFLFSPTYLNKVMHYDITNTGIWSGIPPFLQFCVKIVSGLINDRMLCIPETPRTKLYQSIAFFGMAAFLCALAFVPNTYPILALILLTCGTSILGFNTGGFYKSAPLIARQYAALVSGAISVAINATMLLIPIIVNNLTPNNTTDEWRWVFFIVAGLMSSANIFYLFFASGDPQPWTREDYRPAIGAASNKVVAIEQQQSPTQDVPEQNSNAAKATVDK